MLSVGKDVTIAAISTPPGAGGIGIVRISGELSLSILKRIFRPKNPSCSYRSHTVFYGHIISSDTGKTLDEVMAVYMAGPKSYTREDVVEIHCHGSYLILESILELIFENGAAMAAPGEFTKRAFLNGRIDLTQAEAVIDLISAKTRKGVDLAEAQLAGSLYKRIDPIRKSLSEMRAIIEVAIDFPDEDVEISDHSEMVRRMENEVKTPVSRLLAGAGRGRLYREGVALVIAGVPNVGKSSLLNALLQEERALVTAVPGTTRDSIEEIIDIEGIPVRIVDTAGIREHAEEVEELGIRRAKSLINKADLVLFLLDGSRPPGDEDYRLFEAVRHKPILMVINKKDLCGNVLPNLPGFGEVQVCGFISAREQQGIEELKKSIFKTIVSSSEQWEEDGCAPNVRHRQALLKARDASDRVLASLGGGLTNDLIAVDLQDCLESLAEIVGETTTEDILDVIFEQFCLGK